MYFCWIFLDHDPGSSHRPPRCATSTDSHSFGLFPSSIDNLSFMRHT
jgi:hypothetical protein